MIRPDNKNSFDLLRICFALFVILTHASDLTNPGSRDALSSISNGVVTFSHLGISGFFTISGYLVYQSFLRSSSFPEFLKKRVLGIFPGLFINLFLVTFLICPFLTSSPGELYSSPAPYRFFIRNLSVITIQYELADIFRTNPYPSVINGSLWTLTYELVLYCSFFILFLLKNRLGLLLRLFPFFIVSMTLLHGLIPDHLFVHQNTSPCCPCFLFHDRNMAGLSQTKRKTVWMDHYFRGGWVSTYDHLGASQFLT